MLHDVTWYFLTNYFLEFFTNFFYEFFTNFFDFFFVNFIEEFLTKFLMTNFFFRRFFFEIFFRRIFFRQIFLDEFFWQIFRKIFLTYNLLTFASFKDRSSFDLVFWIHCILFRNRPNLRLFLGYGSQKEKRVRLKKPGKNMDPLVWHLWSRRPTKSTFMVLNIGTISLTMKIWGLSFSASSKKPLMDVTSSGIYTVLHIYSLRSTVPNMTLKVTSKGPDHLSHG